MAAPKPLDPKSLIGNPARTVPAPGQSSPIPLNLDEAMNRTPLPSGIPYPFAVSALQMDNAQILANEQAGLDYNGVVLPFMNYMSSNNLRKPDETHLQHICTTAGVIFTYDGETYKPGKYVPG